MSRSFDFEHCSRLTAGAVGEPGERTFFIQAQASGDQATILVEKEQVRVLSEALIRLLSQLPDQEASAEDPEAWLLELQEPLEPEWRADEISIEYDDVSDRITILLEEAVPEDDEPVEQAVQASARFVATRAQARAMAEHGLEVVSAGRPRCQLCGYPMDGPSHVCPAMNGFRGPAE